jgi:hypothetical protein
MKLPPVTIRYFTITSEVAKELLRCLMRAAFYIEFA